MILTIPGIRFFVAILASFACFFSYVCRFNLSVAILDMVNPGAKISEGRAIKAGAEMLPTSDEMLALYNYNSEPPPLVDAVPTSEIVHQVSPGSPSTTPWPPLSTTTTQSYENVSSPESRQDKVTNPNRVDWTKEDTSVLLSAFFVGYVIAQIPATRCAEIWGAKWLFVSAGLGSGLISLIFPWVALNTHFYFACASRVLMGVLQSSLFPASYVLLSDWLPPKERSKWLAVPSSFSRIGTIAMFMLCGKVMREYDWQGVFYISALTTLIWTALWLVIGSSRPRDNYFIGQRELFHIEANLEVRTEVKDINMQSGTKKLLKKPVDWIKLIKTRGVWLMTLVMFSSEWSNMLIYIKMPEFFKSELFMSIDEIGNWSSALVLLYCFNFPFSGYLSAKMIEKEFLGMSSLQVRKFFELLAQISQATGCFMLIFFEQKALILMALFIIMFGRSSVGGGQCQLPADLSKEYSGTVFAFGNTISNMASFIGPVISSLVTWTNLWIMSTVIFVISGLLFLVFAENECHDFGRHSASPNFASTSRLSLNKNVEFDLKPSASLSPLPQFSPFRFKPKGDNNLDMIDSPSKETESKF